MDDKQHIINLFNQAENFSTRQINRRTILKYSGLSFLSYCVLGCSSDIKDIEALSLESEFQQFIEVVFPATELGLELYRASLLKRISNLKDNKAHVVIALYKRFKARLYLKTFFGNKTYTQDLGVICLADILQSMHSESSNRALDIIYRELSKIDGLVDTIWGRPFSLTDKKCIYWDNYDQAVS